MGKALACGLDHWELFAGHLVDGRVEIDNNLVENAMRPRQAGREELALLRLGKCRSPGRAHLHQENRKDQLSCAPARMKPLPVRPLPAFRRKVLKT